METDNQTQLLNKNSNLTWKWNSFLAKTWRKSGKPNPKLNKKKQTVY